METRCRTDYPDNVDESYLKVSLLLSTTVRNPLKSAFKYWRDTRGRGCAKASRSAVTSPRTTSAKVKNRGRQRGSAGSLRMQKHQNESINQLPKWSPTSQTYAKKKKTGVLQCRLHKQEAWCQEAHSCSPSRAGVSSHLGCVFFTREGMTYVHMMLHCRHSNLFTPTLLLLSPLPKPSHFIGVLHRCLNPTSPVCSALIQSRQQYMEGGKNSWC